MQIAKVVGFEGLTFGKPLTDSKTMLDDSYSENYRKFLLILKKILLITLKELFVVFSLGLRITILINLHAEMKNP